MHALDSLIAQPVNAINAEANTLTLGDGQTLAYDYLVMNDDLELAYHQFESIIYATRASLERMAPAAQRILEGF